jgi:multicomponent Na+:H+ antiporter subunit D
MDSFWIPAPILLPLAMAFLMPIFEHFSRPLRTLLAILTGVGTVALLLRMAPTVFAGETLVYWMSDWTPRIGATGTTTAIGISLSIDAWSLFIALIAAGVGTMSLLYASMYMRYQTGRGPFYVLMLLLIAALVGFALSGDLFNQFVWLEVFSVAAFALTGFNVEERVSVEGAFKYLITNSIASFFIAVGLSLLYMNTGGLNLAQIARDFVPNAGGWVGVGLLIGGYATKAALVPWHFWLPDAHSVAPAPVSAVFSGALIKVGAYAVARCALTLVPLVPALRIGLLAVSVLTILIGGIQMLQQNNPKRILAFSSVAQMGYVMLGLALGTGAGIAAATMHILSHAMLKSVLFMGAGNVISQTGLHSLDEGGGLARRMPMTCLLMIVAGLGLSGMPLLSAFISKTMLEEAAVEAGLSGLSYVLIAGSILTFAGLGRMLWRLFAPRLPSEGESALELRDDAPALPHSNAVESHPLMLLPMILLIVGSIFVGVRAEWVAEQLAIPVSAALLDRDAYIMAVMDGTESSEVEVHEEVHLPSALDIQAFGIPLLTIVVGTVLAWGTLNPTSRLRLAQPVLMGLKRWHTGIIGDYALWNAFGTAALLIVILIATRIR